MFQADRQLQFLSLSKVFSRQFASSTAMPVQSRNKLCFGFLCIFSDHATVKLHYLLRPIASVVAQGHAPTALEVSILVNHMCHAPYTDNSL